MRNSISFRFKSCFHIPTILLFLFSSFAAMIDYVKRKTETRGGNIQIAGKLSKFICTFSHRRGIPWQREWNFVESFADGGRVTELWYVSSSVLQNNWKRSDVNGFQHKAVISLESCQVSDHAREPSGCFTFSEHFRRKISERSKITRVILLDVHSSSAGNYETDHANESETRIQRRGKKSEERALFNSFRFHGKTGHYGIYTKSCSTRNWQCRQLKLRQGPKAQK